MGNAHGDHDHDHDHDRHGAGDHGCSPGEDYERNLAEARTHSLTRRQVLRTLGASGLLIAGGGIYGGRAVGAGRQGNPGGVQEEDELDSAAIGLAARQSQPYTPQGSGDFDGFFFLSGDHHIHTRYSSDGKYSVQRQVAEANYFRLDWMVITDHGGPTHNRIGVDLTYPEIVRARDAFRRMLVFTGLEWNIPGAEHATVIVQPTAAEREQIKQFEAAYDAGIVGNAEEKALEGLRSLQGVEPRPLFFANHPARRGLDSPREIRNWKAAGPDVAYGFEGAPGHQAAGLIRDAEGKFVAYRGFYGSSPGAESFPGYPRESYFTYGGFDWMTAKLGGVWDSLLGDGIRWWITANSDSHGYYSDLQDVDRGAFNQVGYVTEADRYFLRRTYGDFRPGEYGRTYVVTTEQSYAAVMAALRAGRSFVVHGDLIDRLKFTATSGDGATATLGDTLAVRERDRVDVQITVRIPATDNFNSDRPLVDHIDLIAGDINNRSATAGPDNQTNPSTHIERTWQKGAWVEREGPDGLLLTLSYRFEVVERDFYIRLRGTNTTDRGLTPALDPDLRGQTGPGESPWDDLWFYTNPIFVRVRR